MSRKLKDFCKPVLGALAVGTVVAGCANVPNRAPIEDRDTRTVASKAEEEAPVAPAEAPTQTPNPLPGAENADKPGYYTVKPGDTLIKIGLENGQNWREIVKWSALENPNAIEVGQVLRVVPPAADPSQASSRPIETSRIESRPLDSKPVPVPSNATTNGSLTLPPASKPPAPVTLAPLTPAPSLAPPPLARKGDDGINWGWPSSDPVVESFDDGKNKGLDFAGKAGDPVFAAAEGRVVYAGSGLRGYGNLIVLKHNDTYLTAYAHNQTLLVKVDQAVRRGQKIAEMGATDSDGVKLHFEIRKLGKPIDPAKLLPPR